MRIFIFLLLPFLLSTSTYAQKRKKKKAPKPVKIDTMRAIDILNPNLEKIVIWKNEVKAQEGTLLNGKKEGVWKTFHKNEKLSNLSEYHEGELVGVSIDFSDKGIGTKQINHQFANDTVIVQDKANPALQHYTIYGKTGDLLQTGSTLKGEKTGVWKDFHPKGNVAKMVTYLENKENGEAYVFDKEGGIVEEMSYQNGLLSGKKISYMTAGKNNRKLYTPLLEEHYKAGKLDGELIKYQKKGQPQEVSNYKNGEKHGTSKWYYESGELLSVFEYQNGVLTGKSNTYYKSGEVKTIANYRNSKLHDEYQTFHENGVLKTEGNYEEGNKEGKWIHYDEDAKKVKTEWYKNGELTKTKD